MVTRGLTLTLKLQTVGLRSHLNGHFVKLAVEIRIHDYMYFRTFVEFLGPVSLKSRNFSGLFWLLQFLLHVRLATPRF